MAAIGGMATLIVASVGCVAITDDGDPSNERATLALQSAIDGDDSNPVEIAFPPRHSATDSATVRIRGKARIGAGIVSIEASGVPAQSSDGFATWSVEVPLALGPNEIDVSVVTDDDERESVAQLSVGRSLRLGYVLDMEVDRAGDRVLAVDPSLDAVIEVDLATGVSRVISSPDVGTGPVLTNLRSVTLDAARDRALVTDQASSAVVAIDLDTGNRSIVADATVGAGPVIEWPEDSVVDTARNRVLILDSLADALVAIDLDTGERSLVSGAGVGAGPSFVSVTRMALDAAANRVLVSDASLDAILAVDLDSGERSILSSNDQLYTMRLPRHIEIDRAHDRALVIDMLGNSFHILAVDLDSGERTSLALSWVGRGPYLRGGQGFALDATRGRMLVTTTVGRSIYTLHPTTNGNQHDQEWGHLTRLDVGAGPRLFNVESGLVRQSSRALITERTQKMVLSVDLDTGERVESLGPAHGLDDSLSFMDGLARDGNDRVLIASGTGEEEIRSFDLRTGSDTVVSSAASPGPFIDDIESLIFDRSQNRILVLTEELGVFAVDRDSGVRTQVSGEDLGTGPELGEAISFALDGARDRLLITDEDADGLLTVDLATGDRSVVFEGILLPTSGDDDDDEAEEAYLGLVAVDEAGDRAVAVDRRAGAIFALDLVTGTHSVVSSRYDGLGPRLEWVSSIFIDPARNLILVTDRQLGGLIAVDPMTGDRVVVSR